ncbi:polymorphic toxin-type HINT domain-containing protein [Kitasatospora sp. NPDC093558]|uniref:polymorphic toxin-type HINT domain-containing protein n=1 Tax=Kitasatospora sp. NPDC093558 TaxID=3155201 RepID=UPI00343CE034
MGWAEVSADSAADSAGRAYASAAAAQLIAEKAGQDAKAINAAFTDAFDHVREQELAWEESQRMIAAWRAQAYENLPPLFKAVVVAFNALPLDKKAEAVMEVAHLEMDIFGSLPIVGTPANLANCVTYGMEGDLIDPDRYTDAALSCAAEIPIGGWGVLGEKLARWGVKTSRIAEALKSTWRETAGLSCLRPNSFPAGTGVLLADGTSRPIEQVRTGDRVLATDPQTGATKPQRVEATIRTPDDRDFTELTVTSPDGRPARITSTDHHPYWSQSRHAWRDAVELGLDDTLRLPDGRTARITGTAHGSRAPQAAYNLTVADTHTYYVLAGATPLLVHNAGAPICAWLTEQIAAAQAANPLIDSLRATGKLPANFYTKAQATALGWEPGKAFGNFVKDGQIGGDEFSDSAGGILPDDRFRIWYEADVAINPAMRRAKQPGWRLLYSNDGLAYVTSDHYQTTYRLPNWKN